ncbi:MAG: sodium:solute symporter, partial [Verrucomicrobia bacterium]|nr:sodium:solute symporter [Verrucomicrobiota bacterium]
MNFVSLDWMIVGVMLAVLVVMALISNRYTKSVADYLAAGRVGGRYMMTMASGMVWIGAINIVAMFELYHTAGFTAMWWVLLTTPLTLYINISGWGVYRLRETRALTTAQYLETR